MDSRRIETPPVTAVKGDRTMPDTKNPGQQQTVTQRVLSIKDDPFYANCTMVETSPFDISILFGRVRPRTDDTGNNVLAEVYEKQIYLSHLQAKALHEALGRSLDAMAGQKPEPRESAPGPKSRPQPEGKTQPAAKPRLVPKSQPKSKPQAESGQRDTKKASGPKPNKK